MRIPKLIVCSGQCQVIANALYKGHKNVLHNLFFAACEIQFRTGGQRSCWADKYPISGLDAILTYYYSFVLVHCQDIIESSFWLDDRSFLTNFIDVGLTASLFCVRIRLSQLLLTIGCASLFLRVLSRYN